MELTRLPEHGSCFVCGSENSKGMGLVWYAQSHEEYDLLVFSEFQFTLTEQGPPGHAHGGAIAAVIDEVMGAVVWRSGLKVVLANLNVNYHKPVPLDTPLRAEGWVLKQVGKLAQAFGQITLADGTKLASGEGMYVHAPHLFTRDYYS
ncbi:MAG: PaaI family thioesterase [Ardenticatenaceae bacterium]|nr:PaaI family thioesterase [Anaerolineales bacterium]MCB8923563.1 PaaI family thioesterase [Ardenticatenaceae bacterium]MCB8991712.1 PaaI family thioesterase [Ardenticatenaceae bacterium]